MLTGLLKKHAAALTKRVNGGGGPHPTSSSASLIGPLHHAEPAVSPTGNYAYPLELQLILV